MIGSRYRLRGEIARGGMGVVIKIHDNQFDRTLAMKRMVNAPDIDGGELEVKRFARFVEEAHITAQLDHPSIVPVYDLGEDEDGCVWYTMKLVSGRELSELIRPTDENGSGEKWKIGRLVETLIRAAEAVAFAHEKGVIHRDLKPANIMVGNLGEVYVMDWGLARSLHRDTPSEADTAPANESGSEICSPGIPGPENSIDRPLMTLEGDVMGTPFYMSPEQAAGKLMEVDRLSDIYSLGAILYEVLAGRPPYSERPKSRTVEVLDALLNRAPEPVAKLSPTSPPELIAICEKAMARKRGERYPSVLEMVEDLRAYLDNRVVAAHRTGPLVEIKKWIHRNPGTAVASAAVIVSLALLAGLQTISNRKLTSSLEREVQLTDIAEERSEDLRWGLYVSRMNLASIAIGEPGAAERINDFLSSTKPEQGEPDIRGWEWYFLDALYNEAVIYRKGAWKGLSWSPDGVHLATGIERNGVGIWEAKTGELISKPDIGSEALLDISWNRKGTKFAFARLMGAGEIWDFESLKPLRREKTAIKHRVAWSRDGETLASVDDENQITLFDSKTWKKDILNSSMGRPADLAWGKGNRLAAAYRDGTLHIWNTGTGEIEQVFRCPSISSISWSKSGTKIASIGRIGEVSLWDPSTGGAATKLEMAPDTRRYTTPGSTPLVEWSPQENFIATAERGEMVSVWDISTGRRTKEFRGLRHWVNALAWSPDGERLAAVGRGLHIWSLEQKQAISSLRSNSQPWSARESNEGDLLAIAHLSGLVTINDTRTQREISHFETGRKNRICAWNPTNTNLVVCGDRGVDIWDSENTQLLHSLQLGENSYQEVAWNSNGSRLAIAAGRSIKIFESSNWTVISNFKSEVVSINAMDWSPDGKWIVVGGQDCRAAVYDADSGKLERLFPPGNIRIKCAAWHPDSTKFAVGYDGSEIRIFSVATRTQVALVEGHTGGINELAWNPEGTRLVSGGDDRSIRIWDSETGDELLALAGHVGSIRSVCWSTDGKRITSACEGGKVFVWDADPNGMAKTDRGPR